VQKLTENNSRLEYLGLLEHSETLNQINKSDVILLPSRFEGFPFVILESLALGKPVIAFDCPTGPSEIITEDSGVLVEYLNIKEFAEVVIKFGLKLKNDKEKFEKNCKKRVLLFSKKSISLKWVNLIKNLD
jgi:glycosyltransferase involved in cell wall biosynthesis